MLIGALPAALSRIWGSRYAAQGIEPDFNNNNAHRGDADGGAGLAFPVSHGISVTGAGRFRSTSAILVCGVCSMYILRAR